MIRLVAGTRCSLLSVPSLLLYRCSVVRSRDASQTRRGGRAVGGRGSLRIDFKIPAEGRSCCCSHPGLLEGAGVLLGADPPDTGAVLPGHVAIGGGVHRTASRKGRVFLCHPWGPYREPGAATGDGPGRRTCVTARHSGERYRQTNNYISNIKHLRFSLACDKAMASAPAFDTIP